MSENKKDVHTEHCCLRHGCKYGIKFWDRVGKLPEPQRGVIYNMGCALQDFERRLWKEIELSEESVSND